MTVQNCSPTRRRGSDGKRRTDFLYIHEYTVCCTNMFFFCSLKKGEKPKGYFFYNNQRTLFKL